jgi:hypothetical protein
VHLPKTTGAMEIPATMIQEMDSLRVIINAWIGFLICNQNIYKLLKTPILTDGCFFLPNFAAVLAVSI